PTRSQNRTVTCRLSASDWGRGAAVVGELAAESEAIALRIRFRWPSATPIFSRSVSVRSGRISRSIAFSAKILAYCASPISSSQAVICSFALTGACSSAAEAHYGTTIEELDATDAKCLSNQDDCGLLDISLP